MLSQDWCQN